MEKRLTISAMLFSVGFVFMLVLAVGAFFFGVQVGSEKIEAKYTAAKAEEEKGKVDDSATPYQQQDLVSFYLTVFSPYREFQTEWLSAMDKLSRGGNVDASSAFKNLSKLASKKAEEASSFNMQKSPLLGDAQVAYIRSMKLFKSAADKAASSKSASHADLFKAVLADSNYKTAVKESLDGQKAYYEAMQKWAATVDINIPAVAKTPDPLSVAKWNAMPITVKNLVIADYLAKQDEMNSFYPHDLTSRVDEFIKSGQASKMKLQTVNGIVELLIGTKAVDFGDFGPNKEQFYASETLPQLPFFYSE
ncbi:hypothetical protein D3P08_08410 [Paenibacillus nanensis]|uniref:Uncharacterized protein n=1 Tax=Paenibacillus nanensis TaxID=393251 RepID=A0A3A1UYW1_9BACL|nr:hypothetical protein [Paenibacillus nanensis]RIX53454.1 hypothetical protein D3P08_08410 [Paenibacillus nanensis]